MEYGSAIICCIRQARLVNYPRLRCRVIAVVIMMSFIIDLGVTVFTTLAAGASIEVAAELYTSSRTPHLHI